MRRVCAVAPSPSQNAAAEGQNAQNGAAVAAVADRGRHSAKEGDCTDAVVGLAASLTVRNLVARCPGTGRAGQAAAARAVKIRAAHIWACACR